MPKQFLDMFGTGRSLLQQTYDRIRPLCDPENILLTTNVHYVDIIREQLPEIPAQNILSEPARRNTAPCICRAAHHIHARNPEASIINIPSDQREVAGIGSTAVFIGNTGYVEIWDPQAREAFESDIDLAALLYGTAE